MRIEVRPKLISGSASLALIRLNRLQFGQWPFIMDYIFAILIILKFICIDPYVCLKCIHSHSQICDICKGVKNFSCPLCTLQSRLNQGTAQSYFCSYPNVLFIVYLELLVTFCAFYC